MAGICGCSDPLRRCCSPLSPSRSAQVPEAHFGEEAAGILLSDRYVVYKKLARQREGLELAFCWAHERHWEGLTVFLDHPEVAMDNNAAERALRGPVVGRKNYYGSGSRWSARLAAVVFTILQTLELGEINPQRWLSCYLESCAESGNRAPPQLTRFLPWEMDPAQRAAWGRPSGREAA